MIQKDRNFLIECALTLALLIASVFLLKPDVFGQYQLFLMGGAIIGFIFSWYNRKGLLEGIKYLTDSAVLIVIAWIGYRIFKSTFLYKEVISILAQGVIILEIIFSFNSEVPEKVAYIRILSLLVFMASPVFPISYGIPLAIVYLLVWLMILRFQFAGLHPVQIKGLQRYYSLAVSLACFFIAMLLTWFIFSNVYLGRIKQGMLIDEDLQDTGSAGGRESDLADSFYSLQDDLQSKITGLALELDSYEKRRQLIYLFSELVKDETKTIEVDKAETGLIDILKREGAGLEGAAKAITFTKTYLDKKGALNLQKNTGSLMDMLRKYPLGIVDKIKITSLANKTAQANSYEQLKENSQALQSAIQKAAVSKYIQKDLSRLARNLAELKAFEIYRRDIKNLEQRPPLDNEEIERKVTDAISDIKHTGSLDDFKQTVKNIRQLKNDARILEQKTGKDVLKNLEEASRIKLDLFFMKKSEEVRKDAVQKQSIGPQADVFDSRMDEAIGAKNSQDFIQAFSGLCQQNNDNNLGQAQGLAQMLDLKTESFKQIEKDKLDNLMKDDLAAEAKKEILEAQEAMEEKASSGDLEKQLDELKSKIKELERNGKIQPGSAAELLKAATDFKNLLDTKIKAEAELEKDDASEKSSQQTDYIGQLQQAIENSSLSSRQKDVLKALADQLLKTQSLSQLEEIKEALEKEFSSLGLPKLSDQERMLLAAAANSIAKELEKKIDSLENVTAEQIKQLQEALEKAKQSKDAQELEKNIAELKEAIKLNTAQDKQEQAKMLEESQKLKDALQELLEKKAPTAVELKEINKINEEVKKAAEIKQQFIMSKALAKVLEKIEEFSLQDQKKAQALKEKLEQMRKSNTAEEVEKIIKELKEISNSENQQEKKEEKKDEKKEEPDQKDKQQWKIYILSSPLIVSQGVTVPLRVISIDKKGYIKELTSDLEWSSTHPQVAWVDELNFLHPLTKGQARIRATYKGSSSKDAEVNVIESIDAKTVQAIKQEVPGLNL